MSDVKFFYQLAKLLVFLVLCFAGGGWLIYNNVAEKKAPITFDDVYPGMAAILVGIILTVLILVLRRGAANDLAQAQKSNNPSTQPNSSESQGT